MSETKPVVSVVCLTYNHEPYLRRALDSILNQKTEFPFEVLVGEDCSPDGSRAILKEYEQQHPGFFRMFYHEKNVGATANLHDLFMRTEGKYLVILETDDYWTDDHKLQKQVDFLESHPEYIGCAHDSVVIDENENVLNPSRIAMRGGHAETVYTLKDLLETGFIFQTSSVLARNVFLDRHDFSVLYQAHPLVGDLTYYCEILRKGSIYILPDVMTAYRMVIKKGGTSAASQSKDHVARTLLMTMHQLVTLEDYYGKDIVDFTDLKRYQIERYLSGWLRKEKDFDFAGMKTMWNSVDAGLRRKTVGYFFSFPFRKLKKLLKKEQ